MGNYRYKVNARLWNRASPPRASGRFPSKGDRVTELSCTERKPGVIGRRRNAHRNFSSGGEVKYVTVVRFTANEPADDCRILSFWEAQSSRLLFWLSLNKMRGR